MKQIALFYKSCGMTCEDISKWMNIPLMQVWEYIKTTSVHII